MDKPIIRPAIDALFGVAIFVIALGAEQMLADHFKSDKERQAYEEIFGAPIDTAAAETEQEDAGNE